MKSCVTNGALQCNSPCEDWWPTIGECWTCDPSRGPCSDSNPSPMVTQVGNTTSINIYRDSSCTTLVSGWPGLQPIPADGACHGVISTGAGTFMYGAQATTPTEPPQCTTALPSPGTPGRCASGNSTDGSVPALAFNASWVYCLSVSIAGVRMYTGVDSSSGTMLTAIINNTAPGYSQAYVCTEGGCNRAPPCVQATINPTPSVSPSTSSPMATPASCSTSVPPIATGGLTCYVGDVSTTSTQGMLVRNDSWLICLAVDHAVSMGSTVREYRGLDAEAVATASMLLANPALAAAAGYSRAIVCATDTCNNPASPADVACRGGGQGMPTPTSAPSLL